MQADNESRMSAMVRRLRRELRERGYAALAQ